jgi:isopentenyl-diphosphate delta-isomerase
MAMEHINHQENIHYMPQGSSVDFYLTDSFPYDPNLVTSCFGLVFYQDKVLFTAEKDIGHLDLDIPGGHRDEDETIESTITREVFEETGIVVRDFSLIGFAEFNVLNPPKDYWYPSPKSYMLFYVAILKEPQQVNKHGIWLTIDEARHIPWVKDNVVLFESMYQEAKYLRGDFTRSHLDVYDETGTTVIGTETYDTVHRQGLWHKGVHVFILNSQGEFAIQKRGPMVQTKPNLLEASAGGHINTGHTAIETVMYELHEEIGISVSPDEIEYVGMIVDVFEEKEKGIKNNEFDEIYLIRKNIHPDDIIIEHKEVSSVVFINAKEFLARGIALDPTIAHRPEEYKILYKHLFGTV